MKCNPNIALALVVVVLMAADKKPEKAKEPAPSDDQILLWIEQLGDESYKIREEATRNLLKAGEAAFDAVNKATKSKDFEVKQRALMIIKLKYSKEPVISLNLESRRIKGDYHIIKIRLKNPTSLPVKYTGHSNSSPLYNIQKWNNGKWVNNQEVRLICGTGLRQCVIPSGKSAIIPVHVADSFFPIRIGVAYSHGINTNKQKVVWSERIEKDSSN